MKVSVDDVAVDVADNLLNFRLTIELSVAASSCGDFATQTQEGIAAHEKSSITLFRNYKQIQWLHTMLLEKFPMVLIPPLPEKPGIHTDQIYIEKKRLQMERYLSKIFSRTELSDSSDLNYFMSERMTTLDVAKSQSLATSLAKFIPFKALLPSDYQNGFRIFNPSDYIDGVDDQEEFMRRRSYVTLMETNMTRIVDFAVRLIKQKEQTAKMLHQVAFAFKDRIISGDGPDSNASSPLEAFYLTVGDLKELSLKQMRQEIYRFGDVLLECKNTAASLKRLMNGRTNALIAYVEGIRQKTSCFEKTQKLRLQLPGKEFEYSQARETEQQAESLVQEAKKAFDQSKLSLTREMIRFEKDKSRDIRKALRDYAQTQIDTAQQRIDILRKLRNTYFA